MAVAAVVAGGGAVAHQLLRDPGLLRLLLPHQPHAGRGHHVLRGGERLGGEGGKGQSLVTSHTHSLHFFGGKVVCPVDLGSEGGHFE